MSADKPGAPDAPTVTSVTDTTVSLAWSPPETDGGAPIDDYSVEFRLEGARKWSRANAEESVSATVYTVTGLTTDADYEFRVAAQNRAGLGPASKPTAPVNVKEPLGTRISTFNTNAM